jgi:lipopolysaccharide export system ATP-binding protein
MPLLQAEQLVKGFGRRLVVKGADVRVESGRITGLLGRNGAGKTTIFQMIVGLVKPDGGRIRLDDEDITGWATDKRAKAGLTYLPQENSIFLKASVRDNLRLALELLPYARRERGPAAQALLDEFGLAALADQRAYSLSGGERRRLEIARALTLKPKFLLLDEPFTGIDPLTIVEIQKILLKLKDRGIGILISDHNVRDTFKVTDRATIIDDGRILVEDTPEAVARHEGAREKFLGREFTFGEEIPSAQDLGEASLSPSVSPRKNRNRKK